MKFVEEPAHQAVAVIAQRILSVLEKGHRIVWLVCGGSNIHSEVEIMYRLQGKPNLEKLLILPMDERYGESGHADSNYRQMQEAGFHADEAIWVDVLAKNKPLHETVEYYAGIVQTSFAAADYIIGLFGLGTDGHTAGVLPRTPAVYETVTSVVGYNSPPYVRITLAPNELIRTNCAFVLAYGESKKEPLERLHSNVEDLEDLPAKLLNDIPEVYVYNDQLADKEV